MHPFFLSSPCFCSLCKWVTSKREKEDYNYALWSSLALREEHICRERKTIDLVIWLQCQHVVSKLQERDTEFEHLYPFIDNRIRQQWWKDIASVGQTVKIWTAMYIPSLRLLYLVLLQGKGVTEKFSFLFTHTEGRGGGGGHKIRSDPSSWTRKPVPR